MIRATARTSSPAPVSTQRHAPDDVWNVPAALRTEALSGKRARGAGNAQFNDSKITQARRPVYRVVHFGNCLGAVGSPGYPWDNARPFWAISHKK